MIFQVDNSELSAALGHLRRMISDVDSTADDVVRRCTQQRIDRTIAIDDAIEGMVSQLTLSIPVSLISFMTCARRRWF